MRVARVVNIYKSVFRGGNGWMCKCHSVELMYIDVVYTQYTVTLNTRKCTQGYVLGSHR